MSDPVSTLKRADDRLAQLQPVPFHLPLGRLAPAVAGGFQGMEPGDWILPGLRERVGAVLRGVPVESLRDRRAGQPSARVGPVSDAPGSRALHAVGLALASGQPVLCFLGIASAASGSFAEALNAAALTQSPVIFLLLRQPIDEHAPVGPQIGFDIDGLATAFGAVSHPVPNELAAVREAVAAARAAGRLCIIPVAL